VKVLVLAGPTGVGKTDIAAHLARRFDLDLISADSRQVYSWLDIGTAKPSSELRSELRIHMVDRVEPATDYSAADYARDALALMRRLRREGRPFMVVGGAGLYIRALFEPFFDAPRPSEALCRRLAAMSTDELYGWLTRVDPQRAGELHPHDRRRIVRALEICEMTGKSVAELAAGVEPQSEFTPSYAVLTLPRDRLHERIDRRFDAMMSAGLLEEVRNLRAAGVIGSSRVTNTFGYAELIAHLDGALSLDQAIELAKAKTRAYARRQLTWFRKLGQALWVDNSDPARALETLAAVQEAVLASGRRGRCC